MYLNDTYRELDSFCLSMKQGNLAFKILLSIYYVMYQSILSNTCWNFIPFNKLQWRMTLFGKKFSDFFLYYSKYMAENVTVTWLLQLYIKQRFIRFEFKQSSSDPFKNLYYTKTSSS